MNLLYSLKVMVLGMLIVFSGLAILICVLYLMGSFMGRKKEQKAPAPAPAAAPAPVPAAEPEMEEVEEEDQDELIAVISAAIAMMSEDGKKLAVRRVRKADRADTPWARAGRLEALDNRF